MHQPFDNSPNPVVLANRRSPTLEEVAGLLKIAKQSPKYKHARYQASVQLNELRASDQKHVYGAHFADGTLEELKALGVQGLGRRRIFDLLKLSKKFSWPEIERYPTLTLEHFFIVLSVEPAAERLLLLEQAGKCGPLRKRVREHHTKNRKTN